MSDFAAAMGRGVDLLYARMGDPARFTFQDETTADCTVIVDRDMSQYGDVLEINAQSIIFRVRLSELSDRPRRGERLLLTDTSEEFKVDRVITSDRFEHQVLAS